MTGAPDRPAPEPWTGIVRVRGGCRDCWGDEVAWESRSEHAEHIERLAIGHHQRTGHETWIEKTVLMAWGRRDDG